MKIHVYFFHKESHLTGGDVGIVKVFYKLSESEPDFLIPFSAIYGFESRVNGGKK